MTTCPSCHRQWERAVASHDARCMNCRYASGESVNLDHVPFQFTGYRPPERKLGGLIETKNQYSHFKAS